MKVRDPTQNGFDYIPPGFELVYDENSGFEFSG
jgi:hypothetical protein